MVAGFSELEAAVHAFPDEPVRLELGESLSLSGQNSGMKLTCNRAMEVEDYPDLPSFTGGETVCFRAAGLLKALGVLVTCLDNAKTGYALGQIAFTALADKSSLELAATNASRLAVCRVPVESGRLPEASKTRANTVEKPDAQEEQQRFPGLSLAAAAWLLKYAGRDSAISLRFGKSQVEVGGGNWRLYAPLCDGIFPKYDQVLSSLGAMPGKLAIRRAEFLETAKRAWRIADDDKARFDFCPAGDGGSITLSAGEGRFNGVIRAAAKKCPKFSLVGDNLLELLKAFPDDSLELSFSQAGEDNYVAVIQDGVKYVTLSEDPLEAPTPDYLEALAGPDQAWPGTSPTALPGKIAAPGRRPSFKAVVRQASRDADYLQSLLMALGLQVAAS
jgi:DNA polymerase III sliding clamp (beta) subunit (PCNA family)